MSPFSCYDHYLYVHHIIIIFINILNLIIAAVSDLVPVLRATVDITRLVSIIRMINN